VVVKSLFSSRLGFSMFCRKPDKLRDGGGCVLSVVRVIVSCRAVAIGGVWGCDTPLKTSCRQMKGFVGKQKIIYHFTVGQYWLRIKKNGKNSVNFVNFRKFVVCHEKFWYVRKFF
jgi:hypothetical protein